ncbi:OPT oligopeptide transporter protein-domain-containing protein [Aspergillus pseudocaelatus]|uniref:OPT oligopeptide transporter protein-domain-containing protein n=1 Tax=Aspergillus pseudocaelatus TaxID=1825620 RepID=A0ABQ6WVE2_9EURO|nr:OPT oligopeptide transporter protein-domain-containing protein [Aspergillus pseudocaelatus]
MIWDSSLEELLRAAYINNEDQYASQEALTLRMWVIGVAFSIIGCGLNTLFTLRSPSISIAQSTAQLLAYPVGRLWDTLVPQRTFHIGRWALCLKPHPFNKKEHILIVIMANISFYTDDSGYRSLFYLLIVVACLPVIVYVLKRRYPTSFGKDVSVPLLLGGLSYIPPATGMNYGSWATVGLLFGVLIRRRHKAWWRSYNFVLSSALDSSVAFAGMIIFFTVYYTGAADRLQWWGTEVHKVSSGFQPPFSTGPSSEH